MGKTSIEWTDWSVNPIRARDRKTGAVGHYCEKISPGCAHCYASKFQPRFGLPQFAGQGQQAARLEQLELFLDEEVLAAVRRRRKPTRIFWCDMTDLFGAWVPHEWQFRCWETMEATPQHTHQVLTKRADRMRDFLWGTSGFGASAPPLKNVWLGVSAENQQAADERIPLLLQSPAAIRFISAEPLLGPLDLDNIHIPGQARFSALAGIVRLTGDFVGSSIDWVIAGGESGPRARPMHPDWARALRDQCRAGGVAFFFKQWGAYLPIVAEHQGGRWDGAGVSETGTDAAPIPDRRTGYSGWEFPDGQVTMRVGKKYAGRLLDGREHNEFPAAGEPAAV